MLSLLFFLNFFLLFHPRTAEMPLPRSHYSLRVVIDTQQQSLAVTGEIRLPVKGGSEDSLRFLLHQDLEVETLGAADPFRISAWPQSSYSLISIPANSLQSKDEVYLIPVKYSGTLNREDMPYGIDQIGPDYLELSANSIWLPLSSGMDNFFTADLELVLQGMNKEVTVVSSGTVTKTGPNTFQIRNDIPQIDVVLVASSLFDSFRYENMTIFSAQKGQPIDTLASQSIQTLQWLNDHFGKVKKLDEGKLVITTREESGYARKNLIILSDLSRLSPEKIAEFVSHEFAHYWCSKVNFQSPHRWLDESMAEYLCLKFIKEKINPDWVGKMLTIYEEEADRLPPVYTSESRGVPSHAVMYRKGVAKLFWLENQIGEEKMFKLFSAWFADSGRQTEDFLRVLGNLTDPETTEACRQQLAH